MDVVKLGGDDSLVDSEGEGETERGEGVGEGKEREREREIERETHTDKDTHNRSYVRSFVVLYQKPHMCTMTPLERTRKK